MFNKYSITDTEYPEDSLRTEKIQVELEGEQESLNTLRLLSLNKSLDTKL